MEEEVITPPMGGGDRLAPEPQGAPRGVRAVPDPFPDDSPEDNLRDCGRRRKNSESPEDMLVDTVSRIQKDLAILPGGRRSRRRRCRGLMEPPARSSITRCLKPL